MFLFQPASGTISMELIYFFGITNDNFREKKKVCNNYRKWVGQRQDQRQDQRVEFIRIPGRVCARISWRWSWHWSWSSVCQYFTRITQQNRLKLSQQFQHKKMLKFSQFPVELKVWNFDTILEKSFIFEKSNKNIFQKFVS